jgi:hypothetical protein
MDAIIRNSLKAAFEDLGPIHDEYKAILPQVAKPPLPWKKPVFDWEQPEILPLVCGSLGIKLARHGIVPSFFGSTPKIESMLNDALPGDLKPPAGTPTRSMSVAIPGSSENISTGKIPTAPKVPTASEKSTPIASGKRECKLRIASEKTSGKQGFAKYRKAAFGNRPLNDDGTLVQSPYCMTCDFEYECQQATMEKRAQGETRSL